METGRRLNELRGPMAIIVFLNHLWCNTGIAVLLPFNKFVTIAVAYFFFVSGYCTAGSYCSDKRYIHKIWRVKMPYLLYLSAIAYLCAGGLEYLLFQGESQIFLPLSAAHFLSATNWFIYELIVFYCLFIVCMGCFGWKKGTLMLGVATVGIFSLAFYLYTRGVVGEYWYDSTIGFWLGVFLKYQEHENWPHSKKTSTIFSAVFIAAGLAFLFLARDHATIWFAIARNLAAVGVLTILYEYQEKILTHTGILKFIGKVSSEIYVFHLPVCRLLRLKIVSDGAYIAGVCAATSVLVLASHFVNIRVKSLLQKSFAHSV